MDRGTWKIQIGDDVIADYTDVVKGDPVGGGPNVIDPGGYGAPGVTFINLARRKIERRMTITITHDNNADSFDWYQTAAQTYAGVADVLITHRDNAGAETTYKITAANVTLTVEEPINVTSITHLVVTGGQAVKQP